MIIPKFVYNEMIKRHEKEAYEKGFQAALYEFERYFRETSKNSYLIDRISTEVDNFRRKNK